MHPGITRLEPSSSPSSERSAGYWVIGIVLLMAVLQWAVKYLPGEEKLRNRTPGASRGDMALKEESLPAEIAGWHRTRFIPAPPPETLPKGQYWWVHQWRYQKDGVTALVSFDQLGESQWHELTWCYRVIDWTIDNRTEYGDAVGGGPYVVAELSKDPHEVALLVFSTFLEDGTWATPPRVDLANLNRWKPTGGALEKAATRFAAPKIHEPTFVSPASGHSRALQCQVLVSNFNSAIPSELDAAVKLHLETRDHFRAEWLTTHPAQPSYSLSTHN